VQNKSTKLLGLSIWIASVISSVLQFPVRAIAACGDPSGGVDSGVACAPASPLAVPDAVTRVTNLLLYIVGIAAVIMLVVGGLRYVLSGGDPKNTTAAKDTILYAVVGIVVALLGYAIVNFVLNQF
jgi:drug/metabolite transporter (DMT)-like permease